MPAEPSIHTFHGARKSLQQHGIVLKRTPHDEFRVNFKGGKEETAYYTNDLADAHGTGVHMAKKASPKPSAIGEAVRRWCSNSNRPSREMVEPNTTGGPWTNKNSM